MRMRGFQMYWVFAKITMLPGFTRCRQFHQLGAYHSVALAEQLHRGLGTGPEYMSLVHDFIELGSLVDATDTHDSCELRVLDKALDLIFCGVVCLDDSDAS